ncbi:MAG: amino acid deaminase [Comamonadaceae bacterium]|nr:MAG: amino acid deaminase [Comamonadaceae bacterium]
MMDDFLLDAGFKSFPLAAPAGPAAGIASRGWNVLAGDLPFPLAVLRETALAHNLAWMQDYTARKSVSLAPHGKTTMSPQLLSRQLAAGAWGLTFASVGQASVGIRAGARNIIIANQVLADADLAGLEMLLDRHAGLRVWFLVDSLAQLALLEAWQARTGSARRFDVLLEIGISGMRTGCRTSAEAFALAQAMARSTAVRLCGIECYEGLAANCDSVHDAAEMTALVRRVAEVARGCDAQALFTGDEILLTAGGSAVFDLVVPMLRMQGLSKPVRGVLRSGCYVTHDHGTYARFLLQVENREGLAGSLLPALEVWALVQSVPEPGLALLTCGRRDISHDADMPLPVRLARHGGHDVTAAPAAWKVTALNDQHAYMHFPPEGLAPSVGDRIALGVSHPCTTFDKWRWMAVVDDSLNIVGAIQTAF